MNAPRLLTVLALLLAASASFAQDQRPAERIVQDSCAACHGASGNQPAASDFPRLAGQHKEYLEKALNDYLSGTRKDAVMRSQVVDPGTGQARLSESEIKALAEYFSKQPGLYVK